MINKNSRINQLMHHLQYLSNAAIHVDPVNASDEEYQCINNHSHEGLPNHSHQQEIDMVFVKRKKDRKQSEN